MCRSFYHLCTAHPRRDSRAAFAKRKPVAMNTRSDVMTMTVNNVCVVILSTQEWTGQSGICVVIMPDGLEMLWMGAC